MNIKLDVNYFVSLDAFYFHKISKIIEFHLHIKILTNKPFFTISSQGKMFAPKSCTGGMIICVLCYILLK